MGGTLGEGTLLHERVLREKRAHEDDTRER